MYGGAIVDSSTWGSGKGGKVTIKAGDMLLDGHGYSLAVNGVSLTTGIYSEAVFGATGDGNNLDITVLNSLSVRDMAEIGSATDRSSGNSGRIAVKAQDILIDGHGELDFTGIFSATIYGSGNANEFLLWQGDRFRF